MRNQEAIDVGFCNTCSPVGEQERHRFACLSVYLAWLFARTDLFPFADTLADERVNRLRVGRHGLVHRDLQKADRILWQRFPSFWQQHIYILQSHTTTTHSANLSS